tara:strand:- start:1828 stop:2154 length:327 start_codon:yes stop_codon:yes gene_type:complete
MKLSELAKEPKLTKVSIDDPAILKSYGGDPIDFWVYDRVDIATFMQLANLEGNQDMSQVISTMKDLILDEKGAPIISKGRVLPNDVMIKAVEQTVTALGNFANPTSKI